MRSRRARPRDHAVVEVKEGKITAAEDSSAASSRIWVFLVSDLGRGRRVAGRRTSVLVGPSGLSIFERFTCVLGGGLGRERKKREGGK